MALTINDINYQEYKRIYEILWENISMCLPQEITKSKSPVDILNEWEKKSKQIAKKGLKEGVRDFLFMAKEFPPEVKAKVDTELLNNNLPSLIKLQAVLNNTLNKVLKRGKIKNLDEYYVIKEYVIDLTTDISEEQRNKLDKYMVEFEMM